MDQKHRVVILGGGFGGLAAAQKLKRAPVEVTLIDRRNFHLFQPLLYQVATGSLSPGEIAAPLRGVLSKQKNTQVLLGEAVDIDPHAKRVILRDGASFEYDSLIVATGTQTSYYGNDSWRQWAPSLKSVEEATAIRHKILYAFERAERAATEEEARAWLTFVIVGAGATGLELSGALAEIARETLRHDFRKIRPQEAPKGAARPDDSELSGHLYYWRSGACRRGKGEAVAGSRASGHARRSLRGEDDSSAPGREAAGSPVSLLQQRRFGGHRTSCGGRQYFWRAYLRVARLAHLAFCPLDVHRRIPKPRAGFHSVGIRVSYVQPGRTADHGHRSYRLGDESGSAGRSR